MRAFELPIAKEWRPAASWVSGVATSVVGSVGVVWDVVPT
jgi:hypothetical protein